MKPNFSEVYQREKQIFNLINEIEKRGLAFNTKRAQREARKLKRPMDVAMTTMQKFAPPDFTLHPPKIIKMLKQLGITDRQLILEGKLTTVADVLNPILKKRTNKQATEFIKALLIYRAYAKTVKTYLLPLAEIAERNAGIVYTSINPTDTRTGRMASRSPNLQNIPTLNPRRGRTAGGINPVRSCFICRRGYANYYFDYSQMEIAVFGLYADEPLILDTYTNGDDIHAVMAETLYGKNYTKIERDRTKDTNYGIIYGMGARGMARYRGVGEDKAKKFLQFYYKSFPSVARFLDWCTKELRQVGYVEDWFGRRYCVPYGQAYKAVNAIVQGSCAQIFKIGLLNVSYYLSTLQTKFESNIFLTVHDEIQLESRMWKYPKEEKIICKGIIELMTGIPQLLERDFRLRVDVSKTMTNWSAKKKVKL